MRRVNCPVCGTEVEWPAKNCQKCGQPIKMFRKMEECRVCGQLVAKSATKCPYCGANNPSMTNVIVMSVVSLLVVFIFFLVFKITRLIFF